MSTPREVLTAAMYHPTSTDKSLVDTALAALRAAGFEVLPTTLVDAVLYAASSHDDDRQPLYNAMQRLRAYREQVTP